jgi:hypothetical protein
MATFTDAKGRQWDLSLTVGMVRLVRERIKVDLGKVLADGQQLADLIVGEPEKFVDLLWVMCEQQAKEMTPPVSDSDFGYGFGGPTIEAATDALIASIADFSHRSKPADSTKKAMSRLMEAIDQKTIQVIEAATERSLFQLNNSAGNSPENSESTPAR